MKNVILNLLIVGITTISTAQNFTVNATSATSVEGGVNVNILAGTNTGCGFLNYEYTITDNIIDLLPCYWTNLTQSGVTLNNNFFIPLTENGNYTINLQIMLSNSLEVCTNYSNPYNGTLYVDYTLSLPDIEQIEKAYALFPNPCNGVVSFTGSEINIKSIAVFDALGRLVKSFGALEEKSIDLMDLKDGVYFVAMQTDTGRLNQKIVVKKL